MWLPRLPGIDRSAQCQTADSGCPGAPGIDPDGLAFVVCEIPRPAGERRNTMSDNYKRISDDEAIRRLMDTEEDYENRLRLKYFAEKDKAIDEALKAGLPHLFIAGGRRARMVAAWTPQDVMNYYVRFLIKDDCATEGHPTVIRLIVRGLPLPTVPCRHCGIDFTIEMPEEGADG